MFEVRIHGRGGQGVVTAAELIAIAAFKSGKFAQAFPSFGVERTGAPVEAYARIDDKEIKLREQIYKPNVLIIQDATLLGVVDICRGCNEKTIIIINTATDKKEIANTLKIKENNIFTVDATKIAMEIIGKNIVNTVILGEFVKATKYVSLENLKEAIKEKFKEKGEEIINKNILAIEKSYNC